jgi:hydrogenase maturation protease
LNLGSPRSDAPGDAAGGVLVIGYGNTLRSDDGVGWYAAVLLAADPRLAASSGTGDSHDSGPLEVLARHQLTPELALDMSRASLVILIDASADDPPGVIVVRSVAAEAQAGGGPGASSHHVGPGELLAVALELYGAAPTAFVVRIGAAHMEVGESLSPEVAAALPAAVDAAIEIVLTHWRLPGTRQPR